jgi:predicted nucleic acid-binding Zn ribbon protein
VRGRRKSRERADRKRRTRPERIGPLVGGVLSALGISEKVERARAAADWEEIAGPHIARVTRRVRVRGRTLLVEVKSAAWVAELSMMRKGLLDRLNAGKKRGKIEKIVFVQFGGDAGENVNGDDQGR